MYSLPTFITIDNHHFGITNKGDYRMVIDCFIALNDIELNKQERIYSCLIMFYEDINSVEDVVSTFNTDKLLEQAVAEMFDFFNCHQTNAGAKNDHKLVDWEQDEQLIISAINKVANTEVRALEYLHWWTFMGYYIGIGESVLSTVVSIRDKLVKGKKLEQYEKEFRRNNPEYFIWKSKSVEQEEAEKEILALWNSGR